MPTPGIGIKHHAWFSWLQIAIEHEALAWQARREWQNDPQGEHPMEQEFKPALIATTSVAFALDALYAVIKELVPPVQASSRWAAAAEVLKRATKDGRTSSRWPQEFKALFADRGNAVHFGESFKTPARHPRGTNVAPEYVTWSPETASRAVDVGLGVLESLIQQPQPHMRQWAEDYRGVVQNLVRQRQGDEPNGDDGE
jgi:hypothetical protein